MSDMKIGVWYNSDGEEYTVDQALARVFDYSKATHEVITAEIERLKAEVNRLEDLMPYNPGADSFWRWWVSDGRENDE